MTRVRPLEVIAACAVLLAGCAPHSPFIVRSTTDVAPTQASPGQPHTNQVYIFESSLPSNVKYERLAEIHAGTVSYGGDALHQMAEKARALGADAVIEVVTWRQPSGFSWAAPHGRGVAVRILNKEQVDLKALGGQWR